MLLSVVAILIGLVLLVWSADKFIDGAAGLARHVGMSPLLIGMVIIGFGTSAPEMMVSAIAAIQGNPALALGNAYGSNIVNIGLVLGLTAILAKIAVDVQVIRQEMPILIAITALSIFLVWDLNLSFSDSLILLIVFFGYMGYSIYQGFKSPESKDTKDLEETPKNTFAMNSLWMIVGLVLLIGSSRLLVWGAVNVATELGVSELVIGLTIVAVGTSLPELASSLIAVKKGEHDMALGNVIGSNLFNTLAVVGIAGVISPLAVESEVLTRDLLVMSFLTVLLLVFSFAYKKQAYIKRWHGIVFLLFYLAYTAYLFQGTLVS